MGLSVSDAPVGRLVDGRYQVEATLAGGGMATVYRARDTRLDRIVALKVMRPELAADEEFVARFVSEARAAARLSHPAVVAVFDQGADGGCVYLAMELVEGQTLRELLRDRVRLPAARAVQIIQPVLAALEAAHSAGLVHRDVKPENVLVGNDGRVKVADFGLARALSDASAQTRGLLLGTVHYVAPEQALGEPATPRSDVYSAGVMLYELLTGVPPHSGATDFVVVRNHIDEDVPPPSLLVPELPVGVDHLVRTATARDPHRRFADAGEFLAAVRRVAPALDGPAEAEPQRAVWAVAEAVTATFLPAQPQPTDRTAVLPAAAARRRLARPDAASDRYSSGTFRKWRGPVLFALVLLLATAAALGAWWFASGRYTVTPSLLGLTVAQAQATAAEQNFTVEPASEQHSETAPAGTVIDSEPAPGGRILEGGEIDLVVSLGPRRMQVPELVGLTRLAAERALQRAEIPLGTVQEAFHGEVRAGLVISQSVVAGEQMLPGIAVSVVVSKGREEIEIPDLIGQPLAAAQELLEQAGFTVVTEDRFVQGTPAGTVVAQDPADGTGYRGDEIRLTVAVNPPAARLPVPDVVGMHVDVARGLLAALGFKVEVRGQFGGGDEVRSQSPEAGEHRPFGSKVRLQLER
ncbi:MAG: Stk1 family PASTA domain-containing Ser/Thr kinase [Jiangellaceae bacterium]|nr:Stk1 family PASTA domain-containing Ser/Thr kinase [Jiangellaceae bacterium]